MSGFVWRPDEDTVRSSNLRAFLDEHSLPDYAALDAKAVDDPEWFWNAVIGYHDIRFDRPFERVLDLDRGEAWPRWCVGGTTNLAMNCLDRQLEAGRGDASAIVWEGEDGVVRRWTYEQLTSETARLAGGLRRLGLGRRDVIALHLPTVPEAAAAFLAIARIGAIALPLFSGFGAAALASRLNEARAVAAITADGTLRRGKTVAMKETLDKAADQVPTLRHVVVFDRIGDSIPMMAGRDRRWRDLAVGEAATPEIVDAEEPLMLMFTSGTTGRPKATVHTHCGAMVKNALDLGLLLDIRAGDRLLWMSDMGWLVGPKTVIGATLLGATMVMAEGTPDYPDSGRLLRLAAEHDVTVLGLAPTVARTMMRSDPAQVLEKLRIMVSTGELWDPDSWLWLFRKVGRSNAPILNYAGGTEVGGAILVGTVLHSLKPCSFGGPVPGVGAAILDETGSPVPVGAKGELVMRRASIGLTRGLWNDAERYMETYWNKFPNCWVQGDTASVDADGLWYLHGRADDTIKIAGKRTGPSEIEDLLLATGLISEAAAVGVPDPAKGEIIVCVCVGKQASSPETAKRLADAVAAGLGTPFRPREIRFVEELPKTRNLKVMRRVLRALLAGSDPGDTSALADPEMLPKLKAALTEPVQA